MSAYPEDQKAYEQSMAQTQADLAAAAASGQEYVRGNLVTSSKSSSELAAIAKTAAASAAKHAELAGTEEAQIQAARAQTSADVAQATAEGKKYVRGQAIDISVGTFELPAGKVESVERNADGVATAYIVDGEKYYTPESTMWKLGYKTSSDYYRAQSLGVGAPSVTVIGYSGQSLQIPTNTIQEIGELEGEAQFEKLIDIGVIEKGSQFIEGDTPSDWSYISKKDLDYIKSEYDKYQKVLDALEPFSQDVETWQTMTSSWQILGIKPKAYDIAAALMKGVVTKEQLCCLFPEETVDKAAKFVEEQKLAAEAQVLASERTWKNVLTGEIISDTEWRALGQSIERDNYVQNLPALVLAVDPKWQILKDRPENDPERVAYLEKWGDKVDYTIIAASLITLPYTMGGLSWLGQAIQIPVKAAGAAKIAATAYNTVVKGAIVLAKTANLYPIVMTAGKVQEEMSIRRLQSDWEQFEQLPDIQKNEWADNAGLPADYNSLSDEEKSIVLLSYSTPPEDSDQSWQNTIAEKLDDLQEAATELSANVREKFPTPIAEPVVFTGGIGVGILEGIGYTASIPLITATLVRSVPAGTSQAVALAVGIGMINFFKTVLPAAVKADPVLASGRIVGLFFLSPAAVYKIIKGGVTRLSPKYIPERAMANEITTVRIYWKQLPKLASIAALGKADAIKLTSKIVDLLRSAARRVAGEKEATITLESGQKVSGRVLSGKAEISLAGGKAVIEVRNVPYQEVIGDTVFHFTIDITKFNGRIAIQGKLFASPQAALRFGLATSRGLVGDKAGIVEIRVPESMKANVTKLLSKGEGELEMSFKGELEPIPGWSGSGVSFDMLLGKYPIKRFTLAGMNYPVKKLGIAELTKIRTLAAKEAAIDMFLGWNGRMQVIRQALAKDPRVSQVQNSIKQLKAEKPEITDNVHEQRSPISHPEGQGQLKTRVKLIPFNSTKTAIFIGLDRSAPSFEFIGGSADPKEILLQSGKWHNFNSPKQKLTWAEAARSQLIGETTLKMANPEYVGLYLGKLNDNALMGGRVYKGISSGKADIVEAWNQYQRYKFNYDTPELKAGVWLYKDGTVEGVAGLKTSASEAISLFEELGVNPATKDLLDYVAISEGFNISNVKVDRSNKWLNKAIDKTFIERVYSGRQLTSEQIAKINEAEIKALTQRLNDITKGYQPGIAAWITAEGELARFAELLHGRRKAVKMILSDEAKAIESKFTEAEKQQILTANAPKNADERALIEIEEAKEAFDYLNDIYDQYGEYILYADNGEYFGNRYAYYLDKLAVSGIGYSPTYNSIRELTRDYTRVIARVDPYYINKYDFKEYPELVSTRAEGYRDTPYTPYTPTTPTEYPPPNKPPTTPPKTPPVTTTTETPPRVPPPYTPRVPPNIPTKRTDRSILLGGGSITKTQAKIPNGSITWRQGSLKVHGHIRPVWKYIPPPWDQEKPITLFYPPEGAVRTGDHTPEQTVQMIGEPDARVPESVSVDLGIADILIEEGGKKISYTGRGLETVAGSKVLGTTKGMSIPATTPVKIGKEGIRGLKEESLSKLPLGTTLKQLVTGNYSDKVPRNTVDKMLTNLLGKASVKDISNVLSEQIESEGMAEVTGFKRARDSKGYTTEEVLKRLPDSKRKQVELQLELTSMQMAAPIRGYPEVPTLNSVTRRKKRTLKTGSKTKNNSEEELVVSF